MAAFDAPIGLSLSSSLRLDKDNFESTGLKRHQLFGSPHQRQGSAIRRSRRSRNTAITKTAISSRHPVSLRMDDNWSLFGSINYDLNGKFAAERGLVSPIRMNARS
ncbi:hypothetical protein [Agrobacterium pusense]|uniref:hypothetical protein n=1 Tax=Agrobacterium pusense TaxID=648995 RepID=UPI001F19A646|nr:hypothetical protein [Agrobacterium pusense]